MSIEIRVPTLPESVTDATIAKWHVEPGKFVKRDGVLLELETDKVMLEVPAPQDGVLEKILKEEGSTVQASDVLGLFREGVGETQAPAPSQETSVAPVTAKPAAPAADLTPSVRRLVTEKQVDASKITGTGKAGRITREDVIQYVNQLPEGGTDQAWGERPEKRVPMSRLRARIAERLVEAQHNAAMLTTFNEVNMQPIMELRARYKDSFEKTHGVKLGIMSFFVKAAIEALKRFPVVNSSMDGNDIVYHGYYDIGIAVSTSRGLVVPVLRDVDHLSMADIEKAIVAYAEKARDGKLSMEEITGGTFTITNGGVFGSMLSTPILNAPQCAILGMHNIVKRPVVEHDQIVIRPIMYVALSYDHRLIDGRESVSFLLTIKQLLEDPSRFLLGL